MTFFVGRAIDCAINTGHSSQIAQARFFSDSFVQQFLAGRNSFGHYSNPQHPTPVTYIEAIECKLM